MAESCNSIKILLAVRKVTEEAQNGTAWYAEVQKQSPARMRGGERGVSGRKHRNGGRFRPAN